MITPQTAGRTYAGDSAAIHRVALDYMQGWYEGDADRMRRRLHPELAKRRILRDPQTGEEGFRHMCQQCMLDLTQQGGGRDGAPGDKRYYAVSVLDVYGDSACARPGSEAYLDFLQLARSQDKWLIMNVLRTENRDRATQQSEPS